ncbi:thioesterase [Saccharibacillus sp. O16]|nr:thioesterase [Saccharibacillus sp. O16]
MGNTERSEAGTSSRWFRTGLKVRYQETDQMAVVYHANYLNWFEIGRTEMIRAIGLSYRDIEEQGVYLPVLEARTRFVSPARYDDRIWIYARITSFSPLRLAYEYEIRRCEEEGEWNVEPAYWHVDQDRPGTLLNTGATEHIWLSSEWKPIRLHKGAPQLYTQIANWLTQEGTGEGENSHEK